MKTSAIAFLLVGGSFALSQALGAAGTGYHHAQTHKMTAELVPKDASASTITVRNRVQQGKSEAEPEPTTGGSTGNEIVLHVEGRATSRLSALQTGDSLILTCRGSHKTSTTDKRGGGSSDRMAQTGSDSDTTGSGKVPASTAGTSGPSSECAAVTAIQKASDTTKTPTSEKNPR